MYVSRLRLIAGQSEWKCKSGCYLWEEHLRFAPSFGAAEVRPMMLHCIGDEQQTSKRGRGCDLPISVQDDLSYALEYDRRLTHLPTGVKPGVLAAYRLTADG